MVQKPCFPVQSYNLYFSGSTETSAGLQKILQEIQPRDTNDFFSNARELESSETEHKHFKPQANINGTNLTVLYHRISIKINIDFEIKSLAVVVCKSVSVHWIIACDGNERDSLAGL